MVLCPSLRISVARFYSLTFMWLSSNEGRRYRVPPNFPVRFRPSDVIEFGSDKKVAILPSFAFHFFFTFGLLLLFSQLFILWRSSLNFCETFSSELWSTCAKPTGYVPGEGAEHAPLRIHKKWEAAGAAAATASPSGSMNGDTSHHSYHQPHCTIQHSVKTRHCITGRI